MTALVTTRGFRDIIAIGRGNRPDLYNLHALPSEPLVPRRLRFLPAKKIFVVALVAGNGAPFDFEHPRG